MGEIIRKNILCWIIRKKIAVPLVGFVFQGEKTMIPYKEFDFLFNEIIIPDLELDFQTPWKSNSEKMRPFFSKKCNSRPGIWFSDTLRYQSGKIPPFFLPWKSNSENFLRLLPAWNTNSRKFRLFLSAGKWDFLSVLIILG